jgi:hypothetical protein
MGDNDRAALRAWRLEMARDAGIELGNTDEWQLDDDDRLVHRPASAPASDAASPPTAEPLALEAEPAPQVVIRRHRGRVLDQREYEAARERIQRGERLVVRFENAPDDAA